MKLSTFDFDLPKRLIAQTPLADRSGSRLFHYDRKNERITHQHFSDITKIFGGNDVLVLNNSRVLPARIAFENKEIFLVEVINAETNTWNCLVRKGKFFHEGREVLFNDSTRAIVERVAESGMRRIRFETKDFQKFLKIHGEMPLPPYIHEVLEEQERYQTVYAEKEGSVAAPTAGLHFTPELLEELKKSGVQIEYVTLHVGLGTFLPVKTEAVEKHEMHAEYYELSAETAARLNQAKAEGKQITAVGSTSLRTLESCVDRETKRLKSGIGKTALFLYPPASFHFVDHLLTNFHLPKSTLIMLIAGFLSPGETAGVEKVKQLYQEAINEKYRFFSFGDAMLIW